LVLEAAEALMLEGGPSAITYSSLAERSGVGRATLYRHWPDIDQLWFELMALRASQFDFELDGDLESDLRRAIEAMRRQLGDEAQLAVMATTLERSLWDELSRSIVTRLERMTPVRRVLDLAAQNGQLPAGTDVAVATAQIVGPLLYRILMAHQPLDDGFVAEVIRSFLAAYPVE
jgi:AcrR family transcriptional regulator